jgi:2-polyprenyl-3-methyl-5-hydroxy-6-metoxy-1,4-benzoquinol methylase
MIAAPPLPTFRDPAGSLALEPDRAIRTIHPEARNSALEFLASPFYIHAVGRGDIVASTIDDAPNSLRLIHPRIPIPTYPWEWTPSQWLAAAELTITLCQQAIAEGWILKDATPLNILFVGPRPILVDVLSFERRDPESSIWLAYGQYIRTFLLPLVMHRMMGWPLALTLFRRDGYEPLELYQSLSWSKRLSPAALWPITLPALLDRRSGTTASKPPQRPSDPEMTAHILQRTLANVLKRTRRAVDRESPSEWANYQSTLTHYTAPETEAKHRWVAEVLKHFTPTTVLDIGANTGEYSALAAASGAQVVALERDAAAADRLYQSTRAQSSVQSLHIQTIHADLARPTPAVGWDNDESSALIPRLEGQFDLVMMLAVVHHLILMEQIPIPAILQLCHRLTRRHLIIEWVPATDPMYISLMRGRDTLYGALTEADLLGACANLFQPIRQETLTNGRILFLFERL